MEDRKKILILGIGNLLFGDEGIGIHVVERMQNMTLPPDVEVIDGGMASNIFPYLIEKREKVVLVDAIKTGGHPGTVYRLSENEFLETRQGLRTTQESEFEDALRATIVMKTNPKEVVVIGIEPEYTGEEDHVCRIGLSPAVESRIPEIIEAVLKEAWVE
ncbi:MAG: hydrogenase maturation protease [Nitrospirota bacterium]